MSRAAHVQSSGPAGSTFSGSHLEDVGVWFWFCWTVRGGTQAFMCAEQLFCRAPRGLRLQPLTSLSHSIPVWGHTRSAWGLSWWCGRGADESFSISLCICHAWFCFSYRVVPSGIGRTCSRNEPGVSHILGCAPPLHFSLGFVFHLCEWRQIEVSVRPPGGLTGLRDAVCH